MNVLYIGIHDHEYPRNSRIRKYIESRTGNVVVTEAVNIHRGFRRNLLSMLKLSQKYRSCKFDYVILAEFSSEFALPAWVLAKTVRAKLVTDLFVGIHETRVGDYSLSSRTSVRSHLYKLSDFLAKSLAWRSFIDTDCRARALNSSVGGGRVFALPVGAPEWAIPALEHDDVDNACDGVTSMRPLRILYYGNYIPLHGVATLIEAISLLDDTSIELTMLGNGAARPRLEKLCTDNGLDSVCSFVDSVPQSELSTFIENADVVVGIFGYSAKASGVIANKVWQGLYCGKVVVTRESAALSEISEIVGPQLIQVKPNNSADLASALRMIALNGSYRAMYADSNVALERYTRSKYDVAFGDLI